MNSRGELTTQQLVGIIILIISFVIILFFIFRLDLGKTNEKEVCHNSVVMVGRGRGLVGALDCRTSYVCISGGKDCEGINTKNIKEVDLNLPNVKEEIIKIIADEMTECWWMFGEGEINYVGTYSGVHCAICSIVKFDEEVQKKFSEISYLDFYKYLTNSKRDSSQTYLKYLYGLSSVPLNNKIGKIDISIDKIFTTEKYSVVTGRNKELITKDAIEYPSFIKSSEISTKTKCEIFDITKA